MRTIDTDELQSMQDSRDEFALINVLPPEKFSKAHIPGSANVPLDSDEFVEQVSQVVGDKKKKVVLYAESAQNNASPIAAQKLKQAGFSNVCALRGGTEAWKQARLPFQTGSVF